MIVHTNGVEIVAPQETRLESRHLVLPAETATMRLDRVGWAGTPFDRKECIHISGRHENKPIEVAVSPDSEINEAWNALVASGVKPFQGLSEMALTRGRR